MHVLMLGDLHARMKAPAGRLDQWPDVIFNKLEAVLKFANENGVDFITQAGDFFDQATPVNQLMSRIISLIKAYNRVLYVVLGQHDLYFWSGESVSRSALRVLEAAGVVKILTEEPTVVGDWHLYGRSWGQPPFDVHGVPNAMLVVHDAISDVVNPYYTAMTPDQCFQTYTGFKLIHCGDWHGRFVKKSADDRYVVNAGAMVRITRSDMDLNHQPGVVLYKPETGLSLVLLPFKPVAEVFDPKATVTKSVSEHLQVLVEQLKQSGNYGVDFFENLRSHMDSAGVSVEVRSIIDKSLHEVRARLSGSR